MPADGIQYSNRVGHFSTSRPEPIVVDAILNTPTLAARILRNGKNFNKVSIKPNVKVVRRSQGQWIVGGETLNTAAENVTIQLEFNRAMYTSPVVDLLSEAMPRQYEQDVDFDSFDYQDAYDEVLQDLSTAFYGAGAGNTMLGLGAIVDNGTNYNTYGGQSRSTYPQIAAKVRDWGGTMSLSKLATLFGDVSDSGVNEMPTGIFSDWTIFDYFESLLTPTMSHEYVTESVSGRMARTSNKDLPMGAGFTSLRYRGIPFMRDKASPSGKLWMLNENYLDYYGDTKMPPRHAPFYEKVSLGKPTKEGFDAPSEFHGFFFKKEQQAYDQLAISGRFVVSGQFLSRNPRREGRADNVNGI